MIFDGEDQVFRLFAFFFAFLPSDRFFSVGSRAKQRKREAPAPRFGCAWAVRLFQIQMTLVYFGAAWAKLMGEPWRDGTALWYVSRLHDSWGRYPMPDFPWDTLWMIQLATWGTVVFELALPALLWIPKTRPYALGAAVLFHLALDYSMNLFLFHPLMLVGLSTFVATDRIRAARMLSGSPARVRRPTSPRLPHRPPAPSPSGVVHDDIQVSVTFDDVRDQRLPAGSSAAS